MSEEAQETVTEEVEAPSVDLSAVPEEVHDYVDVEAYQNNENYKRAIEHGWKPKELHEKEGGDPDEWTGPAAFNRRYDDSQERKALKSQIKDMSSNVDALISSFEDQKKQAVEQALAEKKAELQTAISEGETEQAVELQNEINQMELQEAPKPQAAQEPAVVQQFRVNNPMFDQNSQDFNPTINAALEAAVNEQWVKASQNGKIQLTDETLSAILDASLTRVKKDLGLDQKPAQKKAPKVASPSTGKPQSDPVKNLSAEGKKMYSKILEIHGEDAAKDFAKRAGGVQ